MRFGGTEAGYLERTVAAAPTYVYMFLMRIRLHVFNEERLHVFNEGQLEQS